MPKDEPSLLDKILNWVWPVPSTRITSQFGAHRGIDIGVASGSTVVAPTGGKVLFAGDASSSGYGGLVKIQSDVGTIYLAHLKGFYVKAGQTVKAGQAVGLSGGGKDDPMKGTSSGPHLHFEIRTPGGGGQINPLTFEYDGFKITQKGGKPTESQIPETPGAKSAEESKAGVTDFLKDPGGAIQDAVFGPLGDLWESINWAAVGVAVIGVVLILAGVSGLAAGEVINQAVKKVAGPLKAIAE